MSYFQKLIKNEKLPKHDGRPIWGYFIDDEQFIALRDYLKFKSKYTLDPRDATLYYAEWWKKYYIGGKPSKEDIFNSLEGNIKYLMNANDFYKKAKNGALMLGVKWLVKQNTLYFRTLLLQGGLPLSHLRENQGRYKDFLLAVLEEQPETIEDFMFKPDITGHLPKSSQNEIIYENCLEVVKSILRDEEDSQYNELLNSDDILRDISGVLKIRRHELQVIKRKSKPKIFWYAKKKSDELKIYLNIGFADSYDQDSLKSILGVDSIDEKNYEFYLDDDLICVFRKMINGKYRVDWFSQSNKGWNGDQNLPNFYIIRDGVKQEVPDFIQIMPNLEIPTLWVKISDDKWRLLKSSGAKNKEASILFPDDWSTHLKNKNLVINVAKMNWVDFEGEITIEHNGEKRKFYSNVSSYDWTISSEKPEWMVKANMPVIRNKPRIWLYDDDNNLVKGNNFDIWVRKHNDKDFWNKLSEIRHIPLGCIDIKIKKDNIYAYDQLYNIGNLNLEIVEQTLENARIVVQNANDLNITLKESEVVNINKSEHTFSVTLNTEALKVPKSIDCSMGQNTNKKLLFELISPFDGVSIVNSKGEIIKEKEKISFNSLYGLRILSSAQKETYITLKNRLKPDVSIIRKIVGSPQPLIQFLDEITRLYYLADVMEYRNSISLEIRQNGKIKRYEIIGYDSYVNLETTNNQLKLDSNETKDLDLYAVPLNCSSNQIELIPLIKEGELFSIPKTTFTRQFIVISSSLNNKMIMPRFINLEENYINIDRNERIENYHTELKDSKFNDEIWKIMMAYFNICNQNELPFSSFDQIRAISRSSEVAARAFFNIGINQTDQDIFLQKIIPKLENDLGVCFHWIEKKHWIQAIEEIVQLYSGDYFIHLFKLLSAYFQEIKLLDITKYINNNQIDTPHIHNSDILELRSKLGEKVLRVLPENSPRITKNYNIPIEQHLPVRLLLQAPIAVAESISGVPNDFPIWGGDEVRESIRRNIQYSQFLNQEFYNKLLINVLNKQ